ncbi:MAG TPA: SOS response-associated peptidase [Bacteroidia bacterium]|jgi:putative SOS response-associated peptidase YedK|nr:SOS response-associated peptidase [Bacteroidia bacterium]HRS39005.1 SOS response-associated peptidase [Bacteroidia bacterium]HRU61832.1 SOS response-associated peptidase [Bacteroidia bacterium]
MCGRYVIVASVEEIEKRFQVTAAQLPFDFQPNFNLGPGSLAPVITNDKPNELQFFTFGMTPFWAKKRMYLFNARAEGDGNMDNDPDYKGGKGIISKPSFRKPIRSQRCLVIADAFIEGSYAEGLDKPHLVYLYRRPFAFAGIWDVWKNPETEQEVHSFAIITTTANPLLQKIPHHRSPVILHERDERRWLRAEHLQEITTLLEPYPAEEMNAYPISPKVKSPKATGRELIEPVGERLQPELELRMKTELRLQGMGAGKRDHRH